MITKATHVLTWYPEGEGTWELRENEEDGYVCQRWPHNPPDVALDMLSEAVRNLLGSVHLGVRQETRIGRVFKHTVPFYYVFRGN